MPQTANRVRSGQAATPAAKYLWGYRESINCMCSAATCDLNHNHDELHTFRRETERRRHCGNEGWICAVADCRCRHDYLPRLQQSVHCPHFTTVLVVVASAVVFITIIITASWTVASTSQQLYIPWTKLNLGKRPFSVAAPDICNELPTTLKTCEMLASFRTHLKTYLF